MASTRVPLSWLLLLAVLAVFGFFAYHILQASSGEETAEKFPPYSQRDEMLAAEKPEINMGRHGEAVIDDGSAEEGTNEQPAPVVQRIPPHAMPAVPGQTEEDLRMPEPLQRTPPTTEYNIPEATDPLNRNVHMSSEFGSNFRHPEQMIEAHPGVGMAQVVGSGLGSEYSGPGGNQAAAYAPEMAQNGGEWMKGISAFDGSDSGVGYSMI